MIRRKQVVIIILILSAFLFVFATASHVRQSSKLRVSYVNVGQGDSALLRDGNGFDLLINGGKTSAVPAVLAYLRGQEVDDIDVMVVTHADTDHVGRLIGILEAADIPVGQVFYNGYPDDTATWYTFETAVFNEGITLTAAQFPQEFTWGKLSAHMLNPVSGLVNPETNDASVGLMVNHGSNQFLFSGDIDSTVETQVVARGTPIAAEILKVAHPGSKYSSSDTFLAVGDPKEGIISVGDNPFVTPGPEMMARLQAAGANVWRTDKSGTIVVFSDGMTYSVHSLSGYVVLLPFIIISRPTPTPTITRTPIPTPITVNVNIESIFYDGSGSSEPDEYVVIRNDDPRPIQLQGFTLQEGYEGVIHVFTFPNFVIKPGQVCRIYTNEYHPKWCGFSYESSSEIWNNTGDCAYLMDGFGNLLEEFCY